MLLDACDQGVVLSRDTRALVVGAGPAGLTLAQELADVVDVLLVEGGGFEASAEIDALNAGKSIGLRYPVQSKNSSVWVAKTL